MNNLERYHDLVDAACPACGAVGSVERRSGRDAVEVRRETIEVDRIWRRCRACGVEFENSRDPDWRLKAFEIYRGRNGLLQPEQIRAWRKSLGLTQAEVTQRLGWGEATLGRYENGSLQTRAHDQQLRILMVRANLGRQLGKNNVGVVRQRGAESVDNLDEVSFLARLIDLTSAAVRNAGLDEATGHCVFDFQKTLNTVKLLASDGELKTKLKNLLFYADFKHFRDHGRSITGLRYARADFGLAPDHFHLLLAALCASGEIKLVEKEADDVFGEIVSPTSHPDISLFSDSERVVLCFVKSYFSGWSPGRICHFALDERAWKETPSGQPISYVHARELKIH